MDPQHLCVVLKQTLPQFATLQWKNLTTLILEVIHQIYSSSFSELSHGDTTENRVDRDSAQSQQFTFQDGVAGT